MCTYSGDVIFFGARVRNLGFIGGYSGFAFLSRRGNVVVVVG